MKGTGNSIGLKALALPAVHPGLMPTNHKGPSIITKSEPRAKAEIVPEHQSLFPKQRSSNNKGKILKYHKH